MDNNELEEELLRCARYGDFGRVRELVEIERVNVNCVGRRGSTPLILAALRGHVHIVRFLLDKDADLHAADNNGETALSHAVYYGNVPMAQLLLEHDANVDAQIVSFSEFEYSLLGWAISERNVGMVALLLRFRANTQETIFKGKTYTAVYLACWENNLRIVQLLINHEGGANVNVFIPRDNDSNVPALSPLCQACRRNNREMVQLLIQRGARVIYNGVYPDSPCPLVHAVVEHGTIALLRLLLDQTNLQREVGNDNHPLSPALEAAIECNKLEAAQLLVDRGANVNDRAFSLLHRFARDGMGGGVRWLLRAGANVNLAERESGETPLWAAAKNGSVDMVKELLKARADVRIRDNNNGETPLGVAHRQGHKGIVYLLLRTSPHVWPHLAGALFDCAKTQEPAPKKQRTS